MTTDSTPGALRFTDGLGAAAEARRWIVCWDDEQGACWPMGKDLDCEGALCALHTGKIAMFASRSAARKAVKVSTAFAKLRKAQGLPANDDFLEGIANVRIVECESA